MNKKEFYWIILIFIIWRAFILISSWVALTIPNQNLFLGGGLDNYLANPTFWGFANFDGEHYLAIAQNGYSHLRHFYFPLYPLLTAILSPDNSLFSLQVTALFISHFCFFIGLVGIWKLLALDFKSENVKAIILVMLVFPTSFYFAANYTESLFLATIVWSFYLARINKMHFSSLFGILASATRIVGLALIPALLVEKIYQNRQKNLIEIVFIITTSLGFVSYLLFLWLTTGNPLAFNAGSEVFGEYRAQEPLLLPRIFYRYVFKIIPNITWSYFPVVFTTLLEFISGLLLTVATITGIFKLRSSYYIFMVVGFLMPSLYNGFVSLPRYALVLFPLFVLIGLYINKIHPLFKWGYLTFSAICLFIATTLFLRGYWIS